MGAKWVSRVGLLAVLAGVVGGSSGLAGCASQRDPIDRVQPNAIPKSFFVGAMYNDSSDDPQFWARTMVVDVPYGESGGDWGLFTNTINAMSRIKWSIEENNLVGRISFERIPGTDGKGLPSNSTTDPQLDPSLPLAQNDGVVVYNFKIDSQFDIRRQYNPTTGEEANIVEENTTDRPWYERDYVRVDFSTNLVTTAYDFDTMSLLGFIGNIQYSPMQFDIRNPNDQNAPVYDIEHGYLDVTNKVFANPQMVDLGGGVQIPGCALPNFVIGGTNPVANCNPNEITLRHSFRRVVDDDYQPANWDGQRFQAYGAFTTDRNGYARNYGLADADWMRYISRYNIWERSHVYTDAENMTGPAACKADADCADITPVAGLRPIRTMSRCDTARGMCTLPYQNRKQKPVVWHYSDGSPPEYFDATQEAGEEWDTAMRIAVQVAKYAECQRFGNAFSETQDCATQYPGAIQGSAADEEDTRYLVKEVNACRRAAVAKHSADPIADCNPLADQIGQQRNYAADVVAIAKMPAMVILCHSPVTDQDPTDCGPVGTIARKGDLRYHLVSAISQPETNSPWGIMSDSNDPTTGEHVSASINVWTYVNDLWAQNLTDIFRYIGGEETTDRITDGTYVNQWVEAAKASSSAGGAIAPVLGGDEADKRIAAIAGVSVDALRAANAKSKAIMKPALSVQTRSPLERALLADAQTVAKTQASLTAPSTWAPLYEARMAALRGTTSEAAIVTPAMQQLAQSGLGDPTLSAAAAQGGATTAFKTASVIQALNPKLQNDLFAKLENAIAQRGGCIARLQDVAPLGYTALANELQNKFGKFNAKDAPDVQQARADKIQDYLRRRAHYSVIAHEMGHSFGLRHNFVSSSDPWNYRPQYWALRTNAKKVTTACPDTGAAASDGSSCIGPRWLDKVTDNEQKNLIQQWAQSSTMEYAGEPSQDMLGIGVFDFAAARMFYGDAATVYRDDTWKMGTANGGAAESHQDDFGGIVGISFGQNGNLHYSQLDKTYNLIESCRTVDPGAFQPSNWDQDKDGTWSALLDGHIVTDESGKPTKCTTPKVDYVEWDQLQSIDTPGLQKSHVYDLDKSGKPGRPRVPHGFASDNWADLGNVSVFRHDNGGDLYEQMAFWQAQQEMTHIFTDYRRGRADFSIWAAFQRTMMRYHEKMHAAAKALALFSSISRETLVTYNLDGDDPKAVVASVLKDNFPANAIASSIAFDHFAHVFARPEPGPHGLLGVEEVGTGNGTTIERYYPPQGTGIVPTPTTPDFTVANGVTGAFGTISLGGRPIENGLNFDVNAYGRDYQVDYTINVGDYYEKAFTAYLMTESTDNFISASPEDFTDPRFRSVSLADLFPDGFRRWLANNLTNDEQIKGVYVQGSGNGGLVGKPVLDSNGYAKLATTSWWPTEGIEACLPQGDSLFCHDPFTAGVPTPGGGTVVDPQVGFEQQKFAMLLTMIYLPVNGHTNWLDLMRIYDVAQNNDPGFDNRIEFHSPTGKIYVAETFGTEVLFGKTVQKGIAARVLEYANLLLSKAAVTEPVMRNGIQVGLQPKLDAKGSVQFLKDGVAPSADCESSAFCQKLQDYTEIPKLLYETETFLGWFQGGFGLRGIYP
jgi:hypothetical protein